MMVNNSICRLRQGGISGSCWKGNRFPEKISRPGFSPQERSGNRATGEDSWIGKDKNNQLVASGIYFIKLETEGNILLEKIY